MTLDVLKFDIEFSEWSALAAMKREGCLRKIRQMVFEIHMWTDADPLAVPLLKRNGFPFQVVKNIYSIYIAHISSDIELCYFLWS